MRPELANHLRDAQDLYSLTKGVLGLCEPYGPVHSFKLVHNRGAARVACIIELESTKQEPALARALGGRSINGSVCVEFEVRRDFEGATRRRVVAIAPSAAPEARISAP